MPKRLSEMPVSFLDFITAIEGDTDFNQVFRRSRKFVQEAESAGYNRYWFSEQQHQVGSTPSVSPVLLGFMAEASSRIRLGTCGMKPSHAAPYYIAEQYETLDALYSERFDIALEIEMIGGTEKNKVLHNISSDLSCYSKDDIEFLHDLIGRYQISGIKNIAVHQSFYPVWIFGSSIYSAQLAGRLGLPYAFAAHFAPALLMDALEIYRESFIPSQNLSDPYSMACVHVIYNEDELQAEYLASSLYQMVQDMIHNQHRPLQPPIQSIDERITEQDIMEIRKRLWYSFFGNKVSLEQSLQSFVNQTGVDEIIISSTLFDEKEKSSTIREVASLFKKS
jgi:luciferase family oxidoreductase group 1